MTGTMKGVCKMAPGPGAEFRTDVPIPSITPDQVLMKVHATASAARTCTFTPGMNTLPPA